METIIICIIAGLGAGLGTGFAGMSAAVVISPMLITFLDVNPYEAIGIALASDVLASAISAITYARNKNIDIKRSKWLIISVLSFTIIGSILAHMVPPATMGNFTVYMSLLMGLRFLFAKEKPEVDPDAPIDPENPDAVAPKKREFTGKWEVIVPIICGAVIGSICGFIGAGGGIMMLILLTTVLNYELKTAVGTSVFIMTFTALVGSTSHFYQTGAMPDPLIFATCVISTLIFALLGARFANKADPKVLNRATGIVLTTLGIFMIFAS
ncbi:MAG: transporter [Epulopiscium sp. Nele67-Bin004]|nr:MAG: transporter [Epulopiscium sp. Nele67-Bin004]